MPGPQSIAYHSTADIIGYGGAAGGGKTDLACGKALTSHRKSMILRRIGTELVGIVDRLEELIGNKDGYNGKDSIWRLPGLQIEFGAVPNAGDEKKYQGRPHDLIVFDEATNFLAQQVRFLLGWLRTTVHGQRCQALLTFNPPTSAEGRWIIPFFGPWLEKNHPNPASPGEIRYAASLPADKLNPNGLDLWVDSGDEFVLADGEPCYEFDPAQYSKAEIIKPLGRTFIPSRITDNPYLLGTGYMSTLQSLPEPLRSQMLNGDFSAGIEDDPWQVIPTAWVDLAVSRWRDKSPRGEMLSIGVDVARGGKDKTVIFSRHEGNWYSPPNAFPGKETPDGPSVAGQIIAVRRDDCPVHIDVIGVGSSPYDVLNSNRIQVIGVNAGEKSYETDKSGRLRFFNLRSELWWKFREELDPANDTGAALPNDPRLIADLTAPKWSMSGAVIRVESRDEIIKRIGRSPDYASAIIMARMDTPNEAHLSRDSHHSNRRQYNPYDCFNQS